MAEEQGRSQEELIRQVEEATERIKAWPEKEVAFDPQLPAKALCTICYLADKDPHPPHVVIVLCPTSPSASITFYRAQDGYLVPADKLIADRTAIRQSVDGIIVLMSTGEPMVSDGGAWALACLICGTTGDDLGTGGEPRRLNVLIRMQEHVMEAHGFTQAEITGVERTEETEGVVDFTLANGTPLFTASRR